MRRGSWHVCYGRARPKLTKTFTAMTSWTWWFLGSVGTLDISTTFRSSPQRESDTGVVQGPFSRLHICGMVPYSPDLNPMDHSIWSILEARVCAQHHKTLEALKRFLKWGWDRMSAEELWRTALNFRKSLTLCIEAEGGQFEAN